MIKTGIAGYGSLGRMHADNAARNPDIDLVCVCDVDPGKLAASPGSTDKGTGFDIGRARVYTDCAEMLKREKPELLLVIAPTYVHEELTVMGLEAGAHVFCEKPMSLTSEGCRNMIRAARENSRHLMTGQCIRFWPEYEYLQTLIENRTYGRIKALIMRRISRYPTWADWFMDSGLSGGAATDLHVHDADWARWIFGEPLWFGATGTYGKTGGIDEITLAMQYPHTSVTVRASWDSHTRFDMSYEAYFEEATVLYREGGDPSVRVLLPDGSEVRPQIEKKSAYVKELEYFVSVIKGQRENAKCAPESALEGIMLVEKEIAMIKGNIK